MKSKFFLLFLFLLINIPLLSEVVFKKDGSVIQGAIVSESPGGVVIRKNDGAVETISRENIIRTLYVKQYLGKVFIRMTNGQIFEGFVVDEDQNSYTVRREINKLDELKIPREKVMFIARSNPNELTGSPRNSGISLRWSPPFKTPGFYNIYLKKGNDNYRVEAKTDKTNIMLGELEPKAKYSIRVTAVDNSGVESLPSNEITVFTKLPPKRPKNVTVTEKPGKTDKGLPVKNVSWDAVIDENGPIKKYRVYRKTIIEYRLLGETSKLSYEIPPGINDSDIDVRSVDENGTESEIPVASSNEKQFTVEVAPFVLFPLGRMGDMYNMSPGLMATAYFSGLAGSGLQMGLSAGYITLESADKDISKSTMIPLTLYTGYSFELTDYLQIIPNVKAGFSMISVDYSSRGNSGTELVSGRKLEGFEPVASAGFILQHNINSSVSLRFGTDIGIVVESGGSMPYAGCYFGATYTFENAGFSAEVDPSVFDEGISVSIQPLIFYTMGHLAEMCDMSPGYLVSLGFSNRGMQNLNFFLSAGYIKLESADSSISGGSIKPLLAGISYSIRFMDELSAAPSLKAGAAFVSLDYESRGESGIELNKARNRKGTEPMFAGGLELRHDVTRTAVISAGLDLGMIYEKGKPLGFTSYTIGAGYKF